MSTMDSYMAFPSPAAQQTEGNGQTMPINNSKDYLEFLRSKEKDKDLLDTLNRWFSDCRNQRQQFERVWYTNIAFYFGRQYVQWAVGVANNYGKLWEPPAPAWRVRLVANKVKPYIRGELSKLTKEKPQAFVIPATSQEEDIIASEAAESIFEHQMRELEFNKKLRQAVFWMVLCGNGFIKNWYDTKQIDSSDNPGTTVLDSISPFHIYVPNVMEEEVENQMYIIHAEFKDTDWAQVRFGTVLQPGESEKSNNTGTSAESQLRAALGVSEGPKNQTLIKEVYVKPSAKYPQGLIAFWTEDELLHVTEGMYYNHKQYPFAKLDHIPTGRFYSDSIISDLIPLQKEYNRTRSQFIENKNLMGRPQFMAPKGSVDPKKITGAPGLIIEYNPGFNPPVPVQMQNVPQYALEELSRCIEDMDDIAAQHEISKGSTPPNVEAATAISYLQEEDDTKLSPTVASIEEAVEKTGRHLLSHVVQFWTMERQVKVLGSDGAFEAFILKGADISGNIDLRVQSGSAAPRSRAGKQAFLMELGKLGWLPPDRILRYLDMAETGRLYEELNIDSKSAQRESYRLSTGQPLQPNTWDNHEIHIMEHNNFRKRQRFELLPDEIKMMFEQHVMLHQQVLMQQQGAMMGQQDIRPPDIPSNPNQPGMGVPQ